MLAICLVQVSSEYYFAKSYSALKHKAKPQKPAFVTLAYRNTPLGNTFTPRVLYNLFCPACNLALEHSSSPLAVRVKKWDLIASFQMFSNVLQPGNKAIQPQQWNAISKVQIRSEFRSGSYENSMHNGPNIQTRHHSTNTHTHRHTEPYQQRMRPRDELTDGNGQVPHHL